MANFWIISDQGYLDFLNALRNAGLSNYLNTLTLRLWVNNFTPAHDSALGLFNEANFNGYAAQLTTNWGAAAVNFGGLNTDTLDVVHTFLATNGLIVNDIYGAYLTDAAGGGGAATKWLAAWRSEMADAGTPMVIDAAGKAYQFQPRLTLASYANWP